MARDAILLIVLIATTGSVSSAQTVHLRIDRREVVLGGHSFGAAGPYEKVIGRVEFSYDPSLPANRSIVDLALAPRNEAGRVECVADFYLLKPVDPNKGNGCSTKSASGAKRACMIYSRFVVGPTIPSLAAARVAVG